MFNKKSKPKRSSWMYGLLLAENDNRKDGAFDDIEGSIFKLEFFIDALAGAKDYFEQNTLNELESFKQQRILNGNK